MIACNLAGMPCMRFLHSIFSVLTSFLHSLKISCILRLLSFNSVLSQMLFMGQTYAILLACLLWGILTLKAEQSSSALAVKWMVAGSSCQTPHCPYSLMTAGTAYLFTYDPYGVWFGHILIPKLFVCLSFNGIEIRLDTLYFVNVQCKQTFFV